jgi:pyridoxal phosphate enzyme (YggS family)
VTKFHPATLVRELAALGVRDVGENRHQEAQTKSAELEDLDLRWHFIGQLQTKKARQAAQYAHAIHSIDRERLVDALSTAEIERPIDAFVQINLTDDPGRGGASPDEIERLAERVLQTPTLTLRGVMAVAPLPEEEAAESAFARLRGYSDRVRALDPRATDISAGMTHDYPQAIAAGATHLRIGSAITGNRPQAG